MPATDEPSEDRVIEANMARLTLKGYPATVTRGHGTVSAMRELIVDLAPDLAGDADRLVKRLRKFSDHIVRLIATGGKDACRRMNVDVGSLEDEYVKSLAGGEMTDRERRRSRRFNIGTVLLSVCLSALLAYVVAVNTEGETAGDTAGVPQERPGQASAA